MTYEERLRVFIDSFDKGNTGFLDSLEKEALEKHVPVIRRETQKLLRTLLALQKPMLLLPLSGASTRGDQELNAAYFEKRGYARVLKADEVNAQSVLREVTALYEARERYIETMRHAEGVDGTEHILRLIREAANA